MPHAMVHESRAAEFMPPSVAAVIETDAEACLNGPTG
jgi:hypothetical protein